MNLKRGQAPAPGMDDDGLQADVMRFMAIIAFCLVAIMALARNAEPLDAAALPEAAGQPVLAALPVPPETTAPVASPASPRSESRIAVPSPITVAEQAAPPRSRAIAEPFPAPSPVPVPAPVMPAQEKPLPAVVATAVTEAAASKPEASIEASPPSQSSAEPAADEGLSLRFASEPDFLRLVNRARIQVFAFREGEVLALSPGFDFRPAPAPGAVYELLPETIPTRISAALPGAGSDETRFNWGLRMPERMERSVRDHVAAGATGVLVIDRFGAVRLTGGASKEETL